MNLQKKFLIMDTRKCIDCENCVLACKRRHGVERFARHGFQVGYIRIPTTCKACDVPDCVQACKFSFMIKVPNQMTRALDDCKGCSLCARKCPFGAIEMLAGQVVRKEKSKRPSLFLKIVNRQPQQQDNGVTLKKGDRKKDVWKCDGCAGFKHRGCTYNCPTGALQELLLEDFITTIPKEWTEELLNYLAPTFLNAEEKQQWCKGFMRLQIDENGKVKLLPVKKEIINAA